MRSSNYLKFKCCNSIEIRRLSLTYQMRFSFIFNIYSNNSTIFSSYQLIFLIISMKNNQFHIDNLPTIHLKFWSLSNPFHIISIGSNILAVTSIVIKELSWIINIWSILIVINSSTTLNCLIFYKYIRLLNI